MKTTVICYYGDVSVTSADQSPGAGVCKLSIEIHRIEAWARLTSVQARKVAATLIEEADRMDGLIPHETLEIPK